MMELNVLKGTDIKLMTWKEGAKMVVTHIAEQELQIFFWKERDIIHLLQDPGNINSFVLAGDDFSVLEQNQSTSGKTISFTLLLKSMDLQKDFQ